MVNDTRGHEAGNQYIRRFSGMLTKHFGHDSCYRISGDEFLVIRTDSAAEGFDEAAGEFERLVKSENTPIAAIGWHCQSALAVETVVTKAETNMYMDKQLFYESHPEYKRDAVELRFRNETDFLMDVLTESYQVLLFADLEKDSYRILRQKSSSVNQGEAAEGLYSVRNDIFCDKFVSDEFVKLRRSVGSIANLREQLKTEKRLICDYRLKDGQWRESTFWKMESDERGVPSKIMYYSQDIDHSMIDRISRRTEAERKYSMIAGLREVYSGIFVIYLDTEKVVLDENLTLPDMIANYFDRDRACDEAREYLIREFLAEGQEEQFRKDTDLLSLRKALTDKKVVSFFYRIRPGFRRRDTYSYCKLSFFRPLSEEDDLLVLATKDITDVVKWARGGRSQREYQDIGA
ncbi:MAG: diguanylate cyclase [Lachnospiraceae bacterium]|nr:diguanylate cyclase [Lachnospiraceae bacterium]